MLIESVLFFVITLVVHARYMAGRKKEYQSLKIKIQQICN